MDQSTIREVSIARAGILSIAATVLLNSSAWAMGRNNPQYLMASLGDSITAATFADTTTRLDESVALTITGPLTAKTFEPMFLIENKNTYSWASGTSIPSHFEKLRSHLKGVGDSGDLSMLNVAVPGNRSRHIAGQAEKIVEAMQSGSYQSLKYVTLLIGANDACAKDSSHGTLNNQFYQELMAGFGKLAEIRQAEPIRVLVAGMPRIPSLGRKEVKEHRTLAGMSCERFRSEVLKLCPSLTHWDSDTDYQDKLSVVETKNRILQNAIADARKLYPNLDIVYSEELYSMDIPVEILAMDCFHPNQAGQTEISRLLWDSQHWFR